MPYPVEQTPRPKSPETPTPPLAWATAAHQGDKSVMQDVAQVTTRELPIRGGTITLLTAAVADGHGQDGKTIAQEVVQACTHLPWIRMDEAQEAIQSHTNDIGSTYVRQRHTGPSDRRTIASAATAAVALIRYDATTHSMQARFGALGNCAVIHIRGNDVQRYTHEEAYAQVGEHNEGVWTFWDGEIQGGDTIALISDGMAEVVDRDIIWALKHKSTIQSRAEELVNIALRGAHTSATEAHVPCYDNAIITLIEIP